VTVVSIIPEVLLDTSVTEGEAYKMIPLWSLDMLMRVFFFSLGSALYFGLSWFFTIPEPEELLNAGNFDAVLGANNRPKGSDEDEDNTAGVSLINQPSAASENFSDSNISDKLRVRMKASVDSEKGDPLSTLTPPKKNHPGNFQVKDIHSWAKGTDIVTNEQRKAWRVAMLMFVSLLVHNFPEGLAVAASALESQKLGITVTIGIMIHNIPEGIAIAIPCLAARPNQPMLSFALASFSGLAEPMGAFVALLFLRNVEKGADGEKTEPPIFNLENILAFVAGVMIMVALWELFPEAKRHTATTKKYFWQGTVCGAVIMIMTELYLP
jgi:ZIP family zinc transporter